ncbi:MAG: SH3 domain-containing protein [Chloroflexi bacterium]|nr:SH3 domain-containing protein [Chloroflexota bacterium]
MKQPNLTAASGCTPRTAGHKRPWQPFVGLLILWLFSLACGSFAPRPQPLAKFSPTPLATSLPTPSPPRPPTPTGVISSAATPDAPAVDPTPTVVTNLRLGSAARVVARTGLNIRGAPSTQAERAGRFAPGAVVKVVDGPVLADGYVWWQVDDGYGLGGWVAAGDAEEVWLDGEVGEPRPVNRSLRLGDVVTVSVSPRRVLTIRFEPGKDGVINRRIRPGILLDVIQGPVILDGLRWWRLRHANGWQGWAAEGDRDSRWLTPME